MIYRNLSLLFLLAPLFVLFLGFDVPIGAYFMSLCTGLIWAFLAIYSKLDEICKLLKDKNDEEDDEKKEEEN